MDAKVRGGRGTLASIGLAIALGVTMVTPSTAHDRTGDDPWDDEAWPFSGQAGHWVGKAKDSQGPGVKTVVDGLISPALGLAVGSRRTVYVSETFVGKLNRIDRNGKKTAVATEPDGISGVDVGRRDRVTYLTAGWVKRLKPDGSARVLNDVSLGDFEASENPDSGNSYGFQGLSDTCKADFPSDPGPDEPGPDAYPGQIDSNPYAVAVLRRGGVVVADAGGNDLVRVARNGEVSVLAVLPPRPFTVTPEALLAINASLPTPLPSCVVGSTYNFEPVPTDVEVGPNGMLYVSSLPGGPEGPALGARGSVFRVNPWNGKVKEVATGFLGAVDLAVDDDGRIYVAELFGNVVTKVGWRGNRTVAELDAPGALEFAHRTLYATTGNGFASFMQPVASVVRFRA